MTAAPRASTAALRTIAQQCTPTGREVQLRLQVRPRCQGQHALCPPSMLAAVRAAQCHVVAGAALLNALPSRRCPQAVPRLCPLPAALPQAMARLKELAQSGIHFCVGLDLEPYGGAPLPPRSRACA